ncbi:MAG: peptide chain release factor N(5)-glutamine methyltransferase, partial [Rickettsiales bacterium]|nr:peptide chain release factor N(5)-glutamine methyltransferase [Rickettsiales bacterium]
MKLKKEVSIVSETFSSDTLLTQARQQLDAAGVVGAALDARILLGHTLGCSSEALLAGREVSAEEQADYQELIARRAAREPVAKIIGYRDFWKDRFQVTADTLDPRHDTETLIEAVLALRSDRATVHSILDLGTGTGCLLLSLLREYPEASGVGVDLSQSALAIAQANAQALSLDNRARFVLSDWLASVEGTYDLIVSNPPYIGASERGLLMPEVRDYDPALALFAGAEGLDAYRSLLPRILPFLNPKGLVAMEVGVMQASVVQALGEAAGLQHRGTVNDLAGIPRIIL